MKKFITFALTLTMILSLAACGRTTPTGGGDTPTESPATASNSPAPSVSPSVAPSNSPAPTSSGTAATAKPTKTPASTSSGAAATAKPTSTPQTNSNGGAVSKSDYIRKLRDSDIAAAKKVAEQYYKDIPNQETMLGVISITFDTEMKKSEMWNTYGDPTQPQFAPGNLAVFSVNTKRYGDTDSIALGRKDANSEWKVLNAGR